MKRKRQRTKERKEESKERFIAIKSIVNIQRAKVTWNEKE